MGLSPALPAYTALILAGGQASRMGGVDKGLQTLHGEALTQHVLRSLARQTRPPAAYLLSANRHLDHYARWGHPVLPDAEAGYPGPLAGIQAGLAACPHPWLLVVPCDAVQLPDDFAQRLLDAAHDRQASSAADPAHWHPTLLALHRNCAASLDAYLARGGRSIRGWLADLDHQPVYFDQPFANANTLDDLVRLAAP